MKIIKLLIVADNPRVCTEIASHIKHDERFEYLGYVLDAEASISVIEESEPDVVLLNMIMPVMDGITLIENIRAANISPKTKYIGMMPVCPDAMQSVAQDRGLYYLIAMPESIDDIAGKVARLCSFENDADDSLEAGEGGYFGPGTKYALERERVVKQLVNSLGVSTNHRGFNDLCDSVIQYMLLRSRNKYTRINVTSDIYAVVAARRNEKWTNVEHSVRYAIETAWLRGDIGMQSLLFGYTVNDAKGKPTNHECISMLAEHAAYVLGSMPQAGAYTIRAKTSKETDEARDDLTDRRIK